MKIVFETKKLMSFCNAGEIFEFQYSCGICTYTHIRSAFDLAN